MRGSSPGSYSSRRAMTRSMSHGDIRVVASGAARDTLHDVRLIARDLATPARLARAASGRRYNEGSLRRSVDPTGVASARVLRSGWLRKIVPSYIGACKRMFYVLYDEPRRLYYYDAEKEPPHANDPTRGSLGTVVGVVTNASPPRG